MGWLKDMATKTAIKLLNIQPAIDREITIKEPLGFNGNIMKNRIWYRGEPSELDQFFKKTANDLVSKSRFWAAVPSSDFNVRKVHSGIPAMIAERLADIVVADMDKIELDTEELTNLWTYISKDNHFNKLIGESIIETLVTGDGAFKITVDTDITTNPIIEYYSGERVDYKFKRGRLSEVHFLTEYSKDNSTYTLIEIFGKGYIINKLIDSRGQDVPLSTLDETLELKDITYEGDFLMSVPMMFFKSPKWLGRGKSIFDSKSDSFDALDETISQWVDAIRDGRVKQYIPESLLPKNPVTGEIIKSNSFDNKYIAIASSLAEDSQNTIEIQQPSINYEAYVNTYASNIDMCLQGIISPATLGIDLKKTDSAESQREKEKTTLYTRGKIIDVLNEVIPEIVSTVLKVNDLLYERTIGEYNPVISFGEYSTPSFDIVVDTVGKAKSYGIMSTEMAVDELYGDTMSDEKKAEEVLRIKEENGLMDIEEPATNIDGMNDDVVNEDVI